MRTLPRTPEEADKQRTDADRARESARRRYQNGAVLINDPNNFGHYMRQLRRQREASEAAERGEFRPRAARSRDLMSSDNGEMRMKKGQQTEKPMPTKCLICTATPVDPSTEGKGADYAFCAGHLATLHDTPAQRARLRQVQADVMLKRVAIAVDANGVGWFHQLPPQPPPRGCRLSRTTVRRPTSTGGRTSSEAITMATNNIIQYQL